MSDYAIQAENINISFNGVQILHNVNFSVKKGEVHSIVGTNGAGKSTLVKILNGVYKKDSGTIKIFGKLKEYNTPDEARRAGIAMVFQDLSLIPTLTVYENIFLNTHPYRKGILIDDKKSIKKALELLSLVGMQSEIDPRTKVEELSTGQKQIVEIAKALSYNSKILILDEPTASLTNKEVENLLDVINMLKEKGISIIFITHSLQDIFKICDRVTVIRDGRIVLTESTDKLDLRTLVSKMTGAEITAIEWNKNKDLRDKKPLLELKNVSTNHIKEVSMKIFPGEIVGIAGLRGSGRSELLDAIFGVERISTGEILIDGHKVDISSTTDAISKGIALVPENRREQGLVLDFSVMENIIISILDKVKKYLSIDKNKCKTITNSYIKSLNIKTQGPEQVVRYLSGGNQQKVVVGKCLASKAKILLLDDPTFGVDVHAKQEIMKIIKDFASRGNGVIFISSQFQEIADLCDSIYIMKRGKVTDLIISEVTKDDLLYMVQ